MQVGGEIGGDLVVGDFQRGEVHLRAEAEIEHELVAVAELDQPAGVGLGAAQERPAGAERGDPHFVFAERLGAGQEILGVFAPFGIAGHLVLRVDV